MLSDIRIRGLGVISDAVLEFGPGLSVVTGETGAGKTMVVTGLSLLFGGRADTSRTRNGAAESSVEGTLVLAPESPARVTVAESAGDVDDDGSLVLRRVLTSAGRSRSAAGGAAVPLAVLARLGSDLVVVHGQSDQMRLTHPSEQRSTLDRYADVDATACRDAFARWRQLEADLTDRRQRSRELAREAEALTVALTEIEKVAPTVGEDVELTAEIGRLEFTDALREAARTAHDAMVGDTESFASDGADVGSLLGAARRALDHVRGTDTALDELADQVAAVAAQVTDISAELASYQTGLDADPVRLALAQERLAVLNGLIRKYGTDVADVLQWSAEAVHRLAASDTSDAALTELADQVAAAEKAYRTEAQSLSKVRTKAAAALSEAITAELAGLAMASARVEVRVSRRSPVKDGPTVEVSRTTVGASTDGIDEVEILLQPHPSAPAAPVQRGASGGELSRVMLAIEVVLAGTDPVPTMIFDEVDAGVGGRAATEIGKRLARLAAEHQVIVVTHLAQVAAFADRHLVVDKQTTDDGITLSDIRTVAGKERVAELARMLSGKDTTTALKHAAELIASARADR